MPETFLKNVAPCSHNENEEESLRRRIAVFEDTKKKFEKFREVYTDQANQNHQRWRSESKALLPHSVRVLSGDWSKVTQQLSKETGIVYAVLNTAETFLPGGGYLKGNDNQEASMYRRSDCYFHLQDGIVENGYYTRKMALLIEGVYLDRENPRICIKGPETHDAEGYNDLPPESYFLFYELKAAADDLRIPGTVEYCSFNKTNMQQKISAQLQTLKEHNVRHVVLSAFGCNALGNPAKEVAEIYREELEKHAGDFDDVVFAIDHRDYGPDNFHQFKETLHNLPLGEKYVHGEKILSALKENVVQTTWDQRGYAVPFFDSRKTPKGIRQIRTILNSDVDDFIKIVQMKEIALKRLANPPKFTRRDAAVQTLYEKIRDLPWNEIDRDTFNQFQPENPAPLVLK